jgi:hypothetical protein
MKYIGFRNSDRKNFNGFDRKGDALWDNGNGGMRLFQLGGDRSIQGIVTRYPLLIECTVVEYEVTESAVRKIVVSVEDS